MSPKRTRPRIPSPRIAKSPTGIQGVDEITRGGLPAGRLTLICGSAGCGKTLMGIEFMVRGAIQFNEPGVFMSFEESGDELAAGDQILAIPTLVRRLPEPVRKIIGDLSDEQRVLVGLDLRPND